MTHPDLIEYDADAPSHVSVSPGSRRCSYGGVVSNSGTVSMAGVGSVLAAIPEEWAHKAARMLNACDTATAQKEELLRIRASIPDADWV